MTLATCPGQSGNVCGPGMFTLRPLRSLTRPLAWPPSGCRGLRRGSLTLWRRGITATGLRSPGDRVTSRASIAFDPGHAAFGLHQGVGRGEAHGLADGV